LSIKTSSPLFSEEQKQELAKGLVPLHVAIIPDGNRRWAKERFAPQEEGHVAGIEAIVKIVQAAIELGVKVLTIFGFSTENWQRSKSEISHLMMLIQNYLFRYQQKLVDDGIRLRAIGNLAMIPDPLLQLLQTTCQKTAHLSDFDLVLAINYGGRDELVRAMKKMACDVLQKTLLVQDITEEKLSSYLDTNTLPELDLLIRTSGEMRISNFLLWQSSYAEVYIDKVPWPDFTPEHLFAACLDFQKRKRRKGGDPQKEIQF
jgi:undecaprenyl diphosphate synthase